jgi:phage protein D
MTPIVQIFLDGKDISSRMNGRILSGSIEETDGERTDKLTLTISNYDGKLAKPAKGAILKVSIGWQETGVAKAGEFKVQEVTKHGEVAVFHVTAQAAALDNSLKTQKGRCWKPPKTYGEVFKQLASDNNLTAAVHASIQSIKIDKVLAQHGESDMHFAMRIARGVGAIAKMAQGRLTIVPKGAGQSASGQALPPLIITPADLLAGWSLGDKERPKRGKCKAAVFDRKTAKHTQVDAGDASNGPDYVFPHIFGSTTEAKHAVSARSAAFKRGEKHFSGSFRPGLIPPPAGGILTTKGFKDDDDTDFTIKKLNTEWGARGIVIAFTAELKATNDGTSGEKGQ